MNFFSIGLIRQSGLEGLEWGNGEGYTTHIALCGENAAICASTPFGIGGIWGWLEPDAGTDPGSGLPAADGEPQFQPATPGHYGSPSGTWSLIAGDGRRTALIARAGPPR